jgi:hypothetical protein
VTFSIKTLTWQFPHLTIISKLPLLANDFPVFP